MSKPANGINKIYSLSTATFTGEAGLKHTGVELDFRAHDKLRLLLENNMRCGPASVMANRYEKKKWYKENTVLRDNKLYGLSMSQYFPVWNFVEIEVTEWNEE